MRNRLLSVLCGSALFLGLALTSANASESRTFSFVAPCDGQQKAVFFNATGLGAAPTRAVQSVEISLFDFGDAPHVLTYIVLTGFSDPNLVLITLGKGATHGSRDFTGFYSMTNTGGVIPFTLAVNCTGGGMLQGLVTIGFFS